MLKHRTNLSRSEVNTQNRKKSADDGEKVALRPSQPILRPFDWTNTIEPPIGEAETLSTERTANYNVGHSISSPNGI